MDLQKRFCVAKSSNLKFPDLYTINRLKEEKKYTYIIQHLHTAALIYNEAFYSEFMLIIK